MLDDDVHGGNTIDLTPDDDDDDDDGEPMFGRGANNASVLTVPAVMEAEPPEPEVDEDETDEDEKKEEADEGEITEEEEEEEGAVPAVKTANPSGELDALYIEPLD